MRIGIVTGEYPPMQGGVGAYSRILAAELAQQGNDIFVFGSAQSASDDPRIKITNSAQRWGLNTLKQIREWAEAFKLDIISLQFQTAAFAMSPWIHFLPDALRQTHVVTTFHDLRYPYLFPKAGPLRDWIVMRLARRSAGIIITNQEDAARLRDIASQALIPIGSNILAALPQDFDASTWRARAGAENSDFLLAYFGLMNRSKGLGVLLASLADLRGRGVPARLVMIGGVGSSDPTNAAYAAEVEAQINESELDPHVFKTGFVNDAAVGSYLKASNVVVLPFLDGASYRRGSLMAALHYGCAIVTTTPPELMDGCVDGQHMLFVPPGDAAALTAALERLSGEPEALKRMRAGASNLAKHFEWPRIAAEHVRFFRRVLGDSA